MLFAFPVMECKKGTLNGVLRSGSKIGLEMFQLNRIAQRHLCQKIIMLVVIDLPCSLPKLLPCKPHSAETLRDVRFVFHVQL